ncbi:ankyrin repeat domain-containing protein 34B [Heterocephalus glaber]|uniref:Ankyrin repeat domain-containing protein 34B n=1 Tax=Heterocephalus glaber TaxID=10181 RepID=A0AAX6P1L7_HETGA|nr:ankyrin repeat domain-containing protein 34B [Heterocephalus glaber]XP_004841664.1 ankyrin repeat domain-containing protein 34B [Heterocephalus glaber]XP_021111361.1 ankyrin repeat domain-containing protein 34B [Heterocephalus glaber]XP_021111362.1 ankyrin repeat domain-containing protein 34B [Heterocephalus glaber]XP_021111363.1 ankyrin repeat domain-containing protein 34B [Heterocephalus glaber]XP_021111364.1 ankyrin repeat domain-containing protein 34B [Heterocephalus glaber]
MDEGAEVAGEGNSLTKAVHQGRLRLTRLLLEGGAYINESNERGETPLMVACRSRHPDSQGAGKARMVRYLLENQADPNIQDKAGLTALMHACLARAGPTVARLLLDGGADLGLQDRAGCSALVHAIHADDGDMLQVLLSACRARGKEVIIITTATSPSGRHTTRQYLSSPPGRACASPSEVDVGPAQAPEAQRALFGAGAPEPPSGAEGSWDPGSPVGKPKPPPAAARGRSAPGLKHQHRVASLQEELLDAAAEEEPPSRTPGLPKRLGTRHQSMKDVKDAALLLRPWEPAEPRKLPCDEGHPPSPEDQWAQDADPSQAACASTLSSIVQRRSSGANHYSSDSQLAARPGPAASASENGRALPGKKKVLSPSPSLPSGSRDALESVPPALGRRGQAVLERRGSGAFALDHSVAQTRPGFLPPLNVSAHPPVPDVNFVSNRLCSLLSCGQRVLVPTVPVFPKEFKSKKMLLRRQSLQTEQIKQLVNF